MCFVPHIPPRSPQPGTPLPAGGCTQEEAPQSSRASNGGCLISGPSGPPQPLSVTAVGPGWARSPPLAAPAPAGSALGGGRLAACPLRSFLKFQIHLSQEEGKLLPLKPLALSSKSSLLGQRRLPSTRGTRRGVTPVGKGGTGWLCVSPGPCRPVLCAWEGLGTPKHSQCGFGVPLNPPS